MNLAHLHLLVNHVPLFALLFGSIALGWSLFQKSPELKQMRWAAIGLLLIAGIFSWIATETGEGAEDLVENLPQVTKAFIHDHEEAAEFANASAIGVALAGLVLIAIERYRKRSLRAAQGVVLVLALLSGAAMARTAYLGGLVRHSEIRSESK